MLFACNNPTKSVSIRRWNTTIGDEDQVLLNYMAAPVKIEDQLSSIKCSTSMAILQMLEGEGGDGWKVFACMWIVRA